MSFHNNSARRQGGAFFSTGYVAKISLSLDASMLFSDNTAGSDGGAVALEDSASFQIDVAVCPPTCQTAVRGNGQCNTEW